MVYKNGHPLELSAREFDILCFLSAAPGRVFSREELMEQVWGYDYYGDLRAVDVAIRRLREKKMCIRDRLWLYTAGKEERSTVAGAARQSG